MIAPPRLSAWFLEASLAASERDAVLGDLCEEFQKYVLPQRGAMRARWWYRWQVARSLAPLFFRSWERATVHRASAAVVGAAVMATGPAAALMMVRTFVLQQVPLKTTTELSGPFVLSLGLLVLCAGGLGVAGAVLVLNADTGDR